MANNKALFQKGYSSVEFYHDFGTEEACREAPYMHV
ncbi:Uncharacterised protein [BD1-7 clade bacterium]|uniref:Uncharacterized protein n=1 Tax=BD1-7 clade bacterium TaxID=2029982 RepID=A0A5S9PRL2_9GAMM|nr:Uncharacterised protein [BD1-7 clade bacterium]